MTQINKKTELRSTIDIYLSKWKLILFLFFVSILAAFLYLRYATYEYKATASIKIHGEEQSNKLSKISSIQKYGIFSRDFEKLEDEIQILKSRTLIKQVVNDLKLNTSYFLVGKVKSEEIYLNPPLIINFFNNDSLLNNVNATLDVKIKSATNFDLTITVKEKEYQPSNHDFGDKIPTPIGDIIITPNVGINKPEVDDIIKVKLTPINSVIESYLKKIKAESSVNSNIIKLSVNESVAVKAEMILNSLIEKYNLDAINDKEEIVKITSDFINNRLDIVSEELDLVDLTAENLKKNNRLSDISAQSSIFLESEKENEAKLITVSNQIQLIDYMIDYLQNNNLDSDGLPANVGITDQGILQLIKSHNDLVIQRTRILRNSSEKNPTIVNLSSQIRSLKNNLNNSLESIKSSSVITFNSLSKEDARISSKIFSTPKKERQFKDITRQQNIKESLYLYLLEKREETAITLGMSSPNAKIIDAAFSTTLPVNPKKSVILLAAIIMGLVIPIGIIYLLDLLDTKIHDKSDILKLLNVPFIGDIPQSNLNKKNEPLAKSYYSPRDEAFRMLRTNIDFMLQGSSIKGGKTVFVTSTTSQEGKSHTSVNLALSLAFSNKKVLLVETDIRVPKLSKYLNLKNKPKLGLTNYIINDKINFHDVIHKVDENLDIISSGTIPPNPAELLMDNKMEILFNAVKNKYDYIIVDTAAVGLVTDTLLISKYADMVVYVIRANYLDKSQLHVAKSMYEDKRLPNMVVLLNGVIHKKGYGYGYGKPKKPKRLFGII